MPAVRWKGGTLSVCAAVDLVRWDLVGICSILLSSDLKVCTILRDTTRGCVACHRKSSRAFSVPHIGKYDLRLCHKCRDERGPTVVPHIAELRTSTT